MVHNAQQLITWLLAADLPGAVETILLNRRALCEVKRQMAAMAAADGASGEEIAHILRPW